MLEEGHVHLRAMTGVIQQLAQLVKDCHARGLVHMGLRPSQILITPSGKIKVGGFGYPKDAVEDMRRIVEVAGDVPVYSAPELAVEGMPRDHRADIYSIGAIYYHGVTGKPPYSGGSVGELLMRISTEDAVPAAQLNPRVPKTISDIIGKMLSIDPVNRYSTVGEMLAALELVVEVDSGVAPATDLAYPEQEAEPEGIRPSRRTRGARGRHAKSSHIGKSPRPARRASTTVQGQAPTPRTASRRTTEAERPAAAKHSSHRITEAEKPSVGTKHASRHMPAAGKSSIATGMIIVAILIGAAIGIGIWYVLKHGG
jgi:serine/threonine protein kinase